MAGIGSCCDDAGAWCFMNQSQHWHGAMRWFAVARAVLDHSDDEIGFEGAQTQLAAVSHELFAPLGSECRTLELRLGLHRQTPARIARIQRRSRAMCRDSILFHDGQPRLFAVRPLVSSLHVLGAAQTKM